jgi:hypothetical protein
MFAARDGAPRGLYETAIRHTNTMVPSLETARAAKKGSKASEKQDAAEERRMSPRRFLVTILT